MAYRARPCNRACLLSGLSPPMQLLLPPQVTITLQAHSKAVHLALLTILSSIVFGIFGIVKVTPLPFRLMLQGTNLMLTFGMSVVLSLFAPNVTFLWSYFISHLFLAFTAAALASCVAGVAVLPSFAPE